MNSLLWNKSINQKYGKTNTIRKSKLQKKEYDDNKPVQENIHYKELFDICHVLAQLKENEPDLNETDKQYII